MTVKLAVWNGNGTEMKQWDFTRVKIFGTEDTMLVKYQPPKKAPDFDAFVAAMYLMFLRAPGNPRPNVDGSFFLGEIGTAPEKKWTRMTPYSLARKESHEDESERIIDI